MSIQLPPIPADVPTLVETSFSHNYGPEYHGIDIGTQWWCEATRRSRLGDAIATVSAPGTGLYAPLVSLTLWADDLYETEAVAHCAIRIARPVARLVADRTDQGAFDELKELLASSGPLGNCSSQAWHRVLEWLGEVAAVAHATEIPTLELHGQGGPEELWTVGQVAAHLGYTGASATGSARKQLSRWGIVSQGREPGRRGQSQYLASEVRAAHEARPGKGRHGASREEGGRFTAR